MLHQSGSSRLLNGWCPWRSQLRREIRDTHCKYCKTESNGRNLVVAIDGTSNQFGLKYSNVVDIYRRIDKEIVLQGSESKQLTYYNSGVGTYANPSHKWTLHMAKTAVESTVDMAIALNFERTILAAYRWLSEKYVRGDRIFLFGIPSHHLWYPHASNNRITGFSRGAYQVRVLAGMIKRVGLLKGGNEEQIPFAYELYESGYVSTVPNMCSEFRKAFSAEAPIHFLGVWDSVSSVGLTRGKGLPLARSWGHICYVRHALALDERRVKFVPEEYYVQHRHGHGVPSDVGPSAEHYVSEMEHTEDDVWKSNTEVSDRLKEVWFVGCHADVCPDKHLIDEFPAMWMANEARFAGLQFKAAHPHWDFHLVKSLKFNESLRSFWRVLEVIPFLGREEDHPNRILPHWGSHRYIKPHQKIHVSVAFVPDYHPKARFWPHSGHSWDNILDHSTLDHIERLRDPIIELDLYDHSAAPHLVDRLRQYLRHEKADSPLTPGPPRHEADVDDALARLTILAISGKSHLSVQVCKD
ncbi:hypothetical protein NEOLEDRAFT_1069304 [Neolentinus lepideus HHB14362 ss-1]|uniref:T6SS Phospholipase effector Tle1-like catalytic domain-containing protein n=1 Tax=Neolentinus lepideus HHB14362 ss-1 TaxID=1314782 RepID=A0A165RBP2_9AGAM|nr:hypothetical protein NEOLEDRAFT_1069304 [Neolentinus lepideus HHB14362 ss-1]